MVKEPEVETHSYCRHLIARDAWLERSIFLRALGCLLQTLRSSRTKLTTHLMLGANEQGLSLVHLLGHDLEAGSLACGALAARLHLLKIEFHLN